MEASLFARLSPELRNNIYEFIFDSDCVVTLQHGSIQPSLTRVCRQLRAETLKLYYSVARFNAHLDDGSATPLAKWLKAIGRDSCRILWELRIWDLHILNATIYGEEAAQEFLSTSMAKGIEYRLRPTPKEWLLGRGWYLKDVVIALYFLDLELQTFYTRSTGDAWEAFQETSNLAVVPMTRPREVTRKEALMNLLGHIGFDSDMCDLVGVYLRTTGLESTNGRGEIAVRRGRRDFFVTVDQMRFTSIRQTYMPRDEDIAS